ncbi:hypothetical protein IAD21_00855 [Abditibacteriota bacterium]|nr:hypothetical protein IAD21_00855 [Abditibacteriota bacterium]
MKKSTIPSLVIATVLLASFRFSPTCLAAPKLQSLIPTTVNTSPDYFCTWNIQGYYSSYATSALQKEAVEEKQMFGKGPYQNWLGQYPQVRQDLYFLLDEGWDLPKEEVMVLPGRFPSYASETQSESFEKLSDAVKKSGWRGLGLWMRADPKMDDFWTERMRWMQTSGVPYWKVDYGDSSRDETWRRHLTELGRQTAPDLTIETAMIPHAITWSDTYRTYDVDALLSVPQTLGRVVTQLQFKAEPPAKGLINCEDEVYLGAALGCSYGVMRHSFVGNLPSGRQDFVFPPLTRDLKKCTDEVVRAVRWHRIAPAFAVGANAVATSTEQLTDNWIFQKDESWRLGAGQQVSEKAPAAVTRGLPLPSVTLASGTIKPFVLASRNPNGAVAIATLGRTLCPSATDRQWITGEVADVTLQVGQNSGPIGIFGRYHSLNLLFDKSVTKHIVIAQDLAGDVPQNITRLVRIEGNQVTIPGAVIDHIGRSAATPGDKSDPGLVLVVRPK